MYKAIGIGSKIEAAQVLTHAASPFRCPRAWDQFIEVVHSRSQIQNAAVTMGIIQARWLLNACYAPAWTFQY